MAAENASIPRSSGSRDVEADKETAVTTEQPVRLSNTDILAETWSKKALYIAFTG